MYLGTTLRNINKVHDAKFQVLTAVSMKFRVFWDVLPCSQIEVDLRTQQYIPEDSELQGSR
jgi:hypothetical protein